MYTIRSDHRAESVIEKSRFICTLKKVADEGAAQEFIKATKKEFWDATHNCSAYLIDDLAQRSSDDGEPAGTAGLPMLEVLRKNELVGVAAVVTRYFGGVKLGAGGLVRAYSGSVAQAVRECGLAQKVLLGTFALTVEAAAAGKLLNVLYGQQVFSVTGVEYGARQAKILLQLPQAQQVEAEQWLTEALNRTTQLELTGSDYLEVPVTREK